MPDGTPDTQAQEASSTTESNGSRSIDSFPEEIQTHIRELRQEAATRRNAEKELKAQLQQYQDRDKTDQQKLEERAATAEGRATSAESKLLRFEVAAEADLPLKYANRLQGSTREQLAEDAKQLAQDFGLAPGGSAAAPGGFDGGPRRPVKTAPKSMNELIAQKAGSI